MSTDRLAAGRAIDATALPVSHDTFPKGQLVAGSPSAGLEELGMLSDIEIGVWEMTEGAVTDVEADEVFIVLAGRATVEFASERFASAQLRPGTILRLTAGMRTVWTVHETLRKVYFTS